MGKILWVIGAGASKHLGMPLLTEFRSFFREIWWRFPENQKNPRLQDSVPYSIGIMDSYPDQNIEQLLLKSSPLTDGNRTMLKNAICRSFERRQLGRLARLRESHTQGIRHKFDAYARLLCCMEDGDAIVSFNYDNAFEFVLACISKDFGLLNVSELKDDDRSAIEKQGRDLWIPPELQQQLQDLSVQYEPEASFAGGAPKFGNGSNKIDLIKIHGSINWFADTDQPIHVGHPENSSGTPLLAYPEPNKPETTMLPLSAIMEKAKSSLNNIERVVIIGYSFPQSDSTGHPFVKALTENMGPKKVLAVDPYPGAALKLALNAASSHDVFEETFENAFRSDKFDGSNLSAYVAKFRKN
jgi:hypothetical protein